MPKKAALIGWFGQGAHADDLIGAVTARELEKVGRNTYFSSFPRKDALISFLKTFDDLIIGGGSIICPTKLHPINTTPVWYNFVNRPLHILGPGFRKESALLSEKEKKLNNFIFSSAKSSWLRGYITEQELIKNGIKRKHNGFGDPGILFEKTENIILAGPAPHLGIVIRNIPDKEVHYAENKDIHKYFIRFIKAWVNKFRGSVHYISFRHVFKEIDCDFFAMSYVKSVIPYQHQFLYRPSTYQEAGNLIASMTHCMSQRLHPTIAALSNNVRCVGLDYQFRKLEDFSSVVDFKYWHKTDTLDKGSPIKALSWLDCGDYTNVFRRIKETRQALQEHIKKTFGC